MRRLFGLTAGALCPVCVSAWSAEPAHAPGSPPHWTYEGQSGPAKWGELSADFKTCSLGTQQTPIDLHGAIKAK